MSIGIFRSDLWISNKDKTDRAKIKQDTHDLLLDLQRELAEMTGEIMEYEIGGYRK